MSVKQYYQCRLTHGTLETIGWIEARGARVGNWVELLPEAKFWYVAEVFDHGLPEDVLRETQRQRRKPPPSLRDTLKDKRQALL
jgi:hypothetical protein